MEKSKAIELLKQALAEIPRLRGLPYYNQAFRLWLAKVETITKEGLEDDDYERLDSVQSNYFLDELAINNLSLEEDYLPRLNDYETALKSIIQKYEILGIVEKPTGMAKPPEAPTDYAERQENQTLGEEVRKRLQGTPEEIVPHILRVAQEFQFPQGFNCYAKEESYKASQFSKQLTIYRITDSFTPDVIWMHISSEDEPQTIGSITLQSLPNNKTLFIAKTTLHSFGSFLERLSSEFKSLGIEETTVQKMWRWFKEIIGIVKAVKP